MKRLYADDKIICEIPEEDEGSLTIPASRINLCMSDLFIPNQAYINAPIMPVEHSQQTNCRNCGAPLDRNHDCPYCGTQHQYSSGIEVTSSAIRFGVY